MIGRWDMKYDEFPVIRATVDADKHFSHFAEFLFVLFWLFTLFFLFPGWFSFTYLTTVDGSGILHQLENGEYPHVS